MGRTRSAAAASGGRSPSRGQTQTLSLAVLTLLALGLTVVLGAFSFGLAPSEDEQVAISKISLEVDNGDVVAVHEGGDAIRADDLQVYVDGGRSKLALSGFTDRPENDTLFRAGERWRHPVEFDDESLRLVLIHEPSGRVLAQLDAERGDL